MRHLRSFGGLLLGFVLIFSGVANAVDYGGVGGRPANPVPGNPRTESIFIYTLKPGQSTNDGVRVFNNTSTKRVVDVYAVDSELASGGAFTCAQKADQKKSVGNWIKLSQASVTLAPRASNVVPFSVTVPAKVSVGEHDGCIVIQDQSQIGTPTGQSGVVLGFRSAIRVAITIPGKIVKKLSITNIATTSQNGQLLVTPTLSNGGNVSLDVNLNSRLSPLIGAGQPAAKNGTFPILPSSQASWNFQVKRPFWGGWYRAKVNATYDSSDQAGLGARDAAPRTLTAYSKSFFVMPHTGALIVEIIILLVIILLIAWVILRQRRARHVRHHWQYYEVKPGENIVGIAKRHGLSWKRLAQANRLKPPYTLHAGQRLRLPPKNISRK